MRKRNYTAWYWLSVPVSTFKGIDENLALSSELPLCSRLQNAVMQYAWPATIIINHLIHHLNQVVNYRGLPFPSAWVSVLLPCAIGCLPLETGRVLFQNFHWWKGYVPTL